MVISTCATVHGLAAATAMKGVSYNGSGKDKIEEIICNK